MFVAVSCQVPKVPLATFISTLSVLAPTEPDPSLIGRYDGIDSSIFDFFEYIAYRRYIMIVNNGIEREISANAIVTT